MNRSEVCYNSDMKSNVKNLGPTEAELKVEVLAADSKSIVDATYKELSEQVKVPGFRKGKVPKTIINQQVGVGYIAGQVTEKVVQEFYSQAAIEADLKVMSHPDIKVEQAYDVNNIDKPVIFVATVIVRPEVKVPELDGETLKIEVKTPTKEEIKERVELFRTNSSTKNEDGTVEAPDDEDLVATLGLESMKELEERVSQELENGSLAKGVADAGDLIIARLLDKVKFELPEKLVGEQVENFLSQNFQGETKPTDADRKKAKESAEKDLRAQIVLDTYADENEIKVENDEIANYLANTAQQYGIDPNQFIQMMVQQGQLPLAAAEVSRSKTLAHMLRRVKVTDQKGKELDLTPWIGVDGDKAQDKTSKKKPAAKKTVKKTAAAPADSADKAAKVKKPVAKKEAN
ncbi:hypothetical protein FACS1894125_1840 [Actinomycetota bacterium]|nr:hypothetical protein FACS1894125_1840 [Actinomycetota bacterium]